MKKIFFTFLLTLLICLPALAVQPTLQHEISYQYYGIREGLSQSQVFYGFQDSFGYLWFATFNGISRFDGHQFVNYYYEQYQDNRFKTRTIAQYKDMVLFLTPDGITCVNPNGKIDFYPLPEQYHFRKGSFLLNGDKLILFNCSQSRRYDIKQFHFFTFDLKQKRFEKSTYQLPHIAAAINKEGKPFAISYESPALIQLGQSNFKATAIPISEDIHSISQLNAETFIVTTLINAGKNSAKISALKFQKDAITVQKLFEANDAAGTPISLPDGSIYFSIGQKPYTYRNRQLQPLPIETLIVNHAFTDCDGNLWLCTEDGVINCFRQQFDNYKLGLAKNDNIWDVRQDDFGNMWFSTYGKGIWRAEKNNTLTRPSFYGPSSDREKGDCGYMGGCLDGQGRLFLNYGAGVAVQEPEKGNRTQLRLLNQGVSLYSWYDTLTNQIFSGAHTKEGRYALLARDKKLNTKEYIFDIGHVISICRDANKRLRIGTYQGCLYLDETAQILVPDTATKTYKGVVAMDLDNNGTLWKGTTHGLVAEYKNGSEKQLTHKGVNFVLVYNNKYLLWGGGSSQLHILELTKFYAGDTDYRTFDQYTGFNILECAQNGGSVDRDGNVWLAGGDRAVRFNPESLMKIPNLKIFPPYIANIAYKSLNDSSWHSVATTDRIVLSTDSNFIRFDLLQASISAPAALLFRYQLNGYSDKWLTTASRTIEFQNLTHGAYQLEIQSTIDGINWSESVLSPTFKISPPLWATPIGISVTILFFVLLIILIILMSRKYFTHKQEQKYQLDYLKHRVLRSKYIPHFTGNVLNSISYLVEKDSDKAQRYIVEFSKFNYHSMHSDEMIRPLKDEIEYAQTYLKLEKLRFEEKLNYRIDIDKSIDTEIKVPTIILQTLCENALKHGLRHKEGNGHIIIKITNNIDYICLSVEDDGIGRRQAKKMKTNGTGNGLNIIEEQIKLFNSQINRKASISVIDLFDDNENSIGTRFEVYLPIQNN